MAVDGIYERRRGEWEEGACEKPYAGRDGQTVSRNQIFRRKRDVSLVSCPQAGLSTNQVTLNVMNLCTFITDSA